MKNPKISTILFDQGEVLLTNDWMMVNPEKDTEFYAYYKITETEFMRGRKLYIKQLITGKISEKDYWIGVLKAAKAVNQDSKPAIEIMHKYQKEKPGVFAIVKKLKTQGYRLGIITTSHKEIIAWKTAHFHLEDYFEVIINSADVGVVKPDPRIYQAALEALKVKPVECIFIDDSSENVVGAEKLGIKGIVFQNAVQLEKELINQGLI
jgi:epoxide hydrolase-like predicted phosphatase